MNLPQGYIYLAIAISGEVAATAALKTAGEFTNFLAAAVVIVGYGTALLFLSLTLRTIPVGVAYAIWAGAGTALIALSAYIIYGQKLDYIAIVGISLIVLGVALVNASSSSVLR